jgi:hypothetical protein
MDTDADMVKAPHWTGKTWLIGELERPAELFSIRTTIMKVHAWMARIWTALAERQRRQRFWVDKQNRRPDPKRRGASLPAAVQNLPLRRQPRWVHPFHLWLKISHLNIAD